jgi:hypothetical protein
MSFFHERRRNERGANEPAAEQLQRVLCAIEYHRHGLDQAANNLQRLLRTNADLRELWSNFTMAGGISTSDLSNFIAGHLPYRRVRQLRHLRLVKDNGFPFIRQTMAQ